MIARTTRTLAFLAAAIPLAGLGFGVMVAGWVLVACLAITPLSVPALVAFRAAVGGAAGLDAELANRVLGTSVQPRLLSPGPRGFWRLGLNVLRDETFWRQQAYLLFRFSAGFGIAVGELSLLAGSLAAISLPVWYRWTDVEVANGWHVDTAARAFACVPVGILGLVIALALARPIAALFRLVVGGLLGDTDRLTPPTLESLQRRHALTVHAIVVAAFNAFLVAIWAFTGRGYFWPEWTLIVLGMPLAIHAWVALVQERFELGQRKRVTQALAIHAGVATSVALFFVLVWAASGAGYFWPLWPILPLALAVTIHAGVELARRGSRISELETSRAGAVVQQETDLARIERDLHDGAQARLVALGMSLGMAEQKLASDPAAAQELLAEARRGTREALEELRNLARGIHPPLLADRGLAAAIEALADRTPVQTNVSADLARRPPRAVETAAYFVVAEALANAGKHAHATRIDISLRREGDRLLVEVVDDGAGGANANGAGLRGLARRVEALDGRLDVESPAGGPTTIRALIPCASS